MSLPPDWTPLDDSKRVAMNTIFKTFDAHQLQNLATNAMQQPVVNTNSKIQNNMKPPPLTLPLTLPAVVKTEAKAAVSAKPPTAVKSVDLDLLRSLKASGVPDQDLILIGAAMIANK